MPIRPWRVLESNYLKKNVRIDICETSDGKIIEPLVLEYGTWVTIVALTKQQEVLLIKQYRHGARKILWELPGGALGEDEAPIVAAKRELLEETGYISDNIIEVGKVSPNPASHTNLMYAYKHGLLCTLSPKPYYLSFYDLGDFHANPRWDCSYSR